MTRTVDAVLRRIYGADASQFGDLHLARGTASQGNIVLIHGGFWRTHRGLEMTTIAAGALAARGWNVWNIEYRRGGPWKETLEDCAAAYAAFLTMRDELETGSLPTHLVGHSAGGQLAAWVAGTQPMAPGTLITLNGVVDLRLAHTLGTGDGAVAQFLGPDASERDLELADPTGSLPSIRVRCLHSRGDERVPFAITVSYVDAARSGGCDVELIEVAGLHTAVIKPDSDAWPTVLHAIEHQSNHIDSETIS